MGGAMGGPMTYGMHGGMWGDGGTGTATASGWLILASVLWRLLILVAVVVLGYLLYRGLTRSGDDDGADAVAELRLAYARGDLSDEEYERRRERLEGEG
jgi:putative membrane protein